MALTYFLLNRSPPSIQYSYAYLLEEDACLNTKTFPTIALFPQAASTRIHWSTGQIYSMISDAGDQNGGICKRQPIIIMMQKGVIYFITHTATCRHRRKLSFLHSVSCKFTVISTRKIFQSVTETMFLYLLGVWKTKT